MTVKTSKFSLGFAASFFIVSVFAATFFTNQTANAAPPTKFSNQSDCNTKLSKERASTLRTYSKKRYDTRKKATKSYDRVVEKHYNKQAKRMSTVENRYKKLTSKDSGVDVGFINFNKESLKKEIASVNNSLDSYNETAQKTSSANTSAEAICNMIYGLRVNTYLAGKIKWFVQIDNARTTNAVNKVRNAHTLAVYEKRKMRYQDQAAAKALVDQLPNPYALDGRLEAVTSAVRAVSSQSINESTPPKAYQQFKNITPDGISVIKEVGDQNKKISQVRKDLSKQKLSRSSP